MRVEKRIACFIAPSDFMGRRLLEWGIEPERVRVIRHFVRAVDGAAPAATIGSYGMFLGRLSIEKGVDVLLAALQRASDPPFLIVGDGPHRTALENLADRLALANTRFLGWRPPDDLGELMAAARYVAVPSVWEENAPLVALEALAAARPLLVSESGGLPELVASGSGVVCRPGDDIDISDKIRLLMEDDELCSRASSEALKFARQSLAPEQHLAGLDALYRELSANEAA
jgi:glycosyltransferase involved in cell wall biosynthesis